MSNKRKGDGIAKSERVLSVVVASQPTGQVQQLSSTYPTWAVFKTRLAAARNHLSEKDPLLCSIQEIADAPVHFERKAREREEDADRLNHNASKKVAEATESCAEENEKIQKLKLTVTNARIELQKSKQELQECNDSQHELRQQTERFKAEASQELDCVERMRESQIMEVTRLRHQISLYALCSGIKWDYSQEDKLAGEVDIQSKKIVHRFSLDPAEFSRYEIARKLASLIEGTA